MLFYISLIFGWFCTFFCFRNYTCYCIFLLIFGDFVVILGLMFWIFFADSLKNRVLLSTSIDDGVCRHWPFSACAWVLEYFRRIEHLIVWNGLAKADLEHRRAPPGAHTIASTVQGCRGFHRLGQNLGTKKELCPCFCDPFLFKFWGAWWHQVRRLIVNASVGSRRF